MFAVILAASLVVWQPETGGAPGGGPADAMGFATSADGLSFTQGAGVPLLARASSPEIIELSGAGKAGSQGTLVVYAVNRVRLTGTAAQELVRLQSTDNGKTWSGGDPVVFEGEHAQGPPGDVAAVQLPDGRVRLYYAPAGEAAIPRAPLKPDPRDPNQPRPVKPPTPMTPEQPKWPNLPPGPDQPAPAVPGMNLPVRSVFSAVSDDGLHFKVEDGARLSAEVLAAPDVVYCAAAGQWLMFFTASNELHLARSRDGLAWEHDGVFKAKGNAPPAAVVTLDGRVRVLLPSGPNLASLVFNPATGATDSETGLRLDSPCADAGVCARSSGGYAMVFLLPHAEWPK